MFRRIILLLCLVFAIFVYAFPCFVLPFGTYKATYTNALTQETETAYMSFTFDGKIKDEDGNIVNYYRLKGNKIEVSDDEDFSSTHALSLTNAYTVTLTPLGYEIKYINQIGLWASVGVGVLALLCIVTIPSRRR